MIPLGQRVKLRVRNAIHSLFKPSKNTITGNCAGRRCNKIKAQSNEGLFSHVKMTAQ